MNEYLSKEVIARYLKAYSEKESNSNSPYGMITSSVLAKAQRALIELPSADVKPVVHSKWIYGEDESGKDGIFCSNCKGFVPWDYEYYNSPDKLISDNLICSHCGARMDGDKE